MSVQSSDVVKAEAGLAEFADNERVVIYINVKGAARSITLGAQSGIKVAVIRKAESLGKFLAQHTTDLALNFDWDDVVSIEFEEFY